MDPSDVDLPALGGGLSIIAAMVLVLRIAFERLSSQDATWLDLLAAAERRAEQAEESLAELRDYVRVNAVAFETARETDRSEIRRLSEQLAHAQLQIRELQHWQRDS